MADSTTQKDTALEGRASPNEVGREDIVIRTMKGDLEKLSSIKPEKEKKTEPIPFRPIAPISQEAQAPMLPSAPAPVIPPTPKAIPPSGPPILIIPPKEIAEIPTKPLFKATPVWLKIGGIGFGIVVLVLAGLYGYWKIFIQSQPVTPTAPIVTTKPPTFPTIPVATTTTPIKFFNKLPNIEITIEISSRTSAALLNALKSEAAIEEARASIKQIKITYQEKLITTEEFFDLMLIFTPQNFLQNYESEFVLAFFAQKEGARPILILKAKNKGKMESQMKDWETKTLASDIFPLFLSNGKLPKVLSVFKSYLFIGKPVRYLNVNMPFASLNYAIYSDFIIFTTSSTGMFVVLQDLTGQTVSQNYLDNLKASINEFVR